MPADLQGAGTASLLTEHLVLEKQHRHVSSSNLSGDAVTRGSTGAHAGSKSSRVQRRAFPSCSSASTHVARASLGRETSESFLPFSL